MPRFLVTGGNKGIGLAVVEALAAARPDATVLLGARSAARGAAAVAALVAAHPSFAGRVAAIELDVTSDASVAAAAAAAGALDGLVCNAGVAAAAARDGLETNLFGVKRCVDGFARAPGAAIVLVSSGVGPMFVAKCAGAARALLASGGAPPHDPWSALDGAAAGFLAALAAREGGDGGAALAAAGFPADADGAYGASKALLNVYAAQLARAGVRAAACSPGFIATDLVRAFIVGKTPEEAGALPPAASTKVILRLLLDESVVPGAYYGSDALRSPIDAYRSPGAPEYAPPPGANA